MREGKFPCVLRGVHDDGLFRAGKERRLAPGLDIGDDPLDLAADALIRQVFHAGAGLGHVHHRLGVRVLCRVDADSAEKDRSLRRGVMAQGQRAGSLVQTAALHQNDGYPAVQRSMGQLVSGPQGQQGLVRLGEGKAAIGVCRQVICLRRLLHQDHVLGEDGEAGVGAVLLRALVQHQQALARVLIVRKGGVDEVLVQLGIETAGEFLAERLVGGAAQQVNADEVVFRQTLRQIQLRSGARSVHRGSGCCQQFQGGSFLRARILVKSDHQLGLLRRAVGHGDLAVRHC